MVHYERDDGDIILSSLVTVAMLEVCYVAIV